MVSLFYHRYMTDTNPMEGRDILLEFIPVGQYVRATAFDTATLTEVSIQGPKAASESLLRFQVIKRLEYVLRKQGHIA